MQIEIRQYRTHDAAAAAVIWNEVVRGGVACPQQEELTEENADSFFRSQSFTGLAEDTETGEIVGLYILHPNNVGRCGHICNTSYAVKDGVRHSMAQGKALGYRILQFNAVVATNASALHLYRRLGFKQLGVIPGGFLMPDGHYEDIIPHYHEL